MNATEDRVTALIVEMFLDGDESFPLTADMDLLEEGADAGRWGGSRPIASAACCSSYSAKGTTPSMTATSAQNRCLESQTLRRS